MIERQLDKPFARDRAEALDLLADDLLELFFVRGHLSQLIHDAAGYQPSAFPTD